MADRCGCPVLWATTAAHAKAIPLDPQPVAPSTRGALYLVDDRWAYGLKDLATKLSGREQVSYDRAVELVRTRYPAHVAHFDRCAVVSRFRPAS